MAALSSPWVVPCGCLRIRRPSIFVMSSRTTVLKPVLVGSCQEMPTMAEFGSGMAKFKSGQIV